MKYRYALFFVLIYCTFSCRNVTEEGVLLNKAEQMILSNPDSANIIVNSIKDVDDLSDADFAHWCILYSRLAFTFPENGYLSQIRLQRTYDYYSKQGNAEEHAYSLMFLGQSYYNINKYDEALDLYLKALEIAQASEKNDVAGYIYGYIGDMYDAQGLYDEATDRFLKSADSFGCSGNIRSEVLALSTAGFCYLMNNKPDSGLFIMLRADSLSKIQPDIEVKAIILRDVGTAYSEAGQLDSAEVYYMRNLSLKADNEEITYYALCDVYIKKGEYQKARDVLKKGTSDYTIEGVYHHRYELEKAAGNYSEALTNLELYQHAADSIDNAAAKMHVLEMEKKYNEEHVLNKLKINKQRGYLMVSALVAFILFILFVYQTRMKHKNAQLLKQRCLMDNMDNKIEDMNKLLEKMRTNIQDDIVNTTKKEQMIKYLRDQLYDLKIERLYKYSSIGKRIFKLKQKNTSQNVRMPLSSSEWSELEKALTEGFPRFGAFCKSIEDNITNIDKHCFLLSFFDLDASIESVLLDINSDSARKYRYNARKKVIPDESDNISLIDYFREHFTN